ncbi:hypothetical protein EPN44_03865 [bacterium]|nr:MAG: hypothetical protein EPN44_03865 [bacterium]
MRAMRVLFLLLAFALAAPAAAQVPAAAQQQPIQISGQILDVQNGYLFFTTGDAFKLAQDAKINGYHLTGTRAAPPFEVGTYALADLDTGSKSIVTVQLSTAPIKGGIAPNHVDRAYVVALSPPVANPDLVPKQSQYGHAAGYTGRDVLVTFRVEVPPNTPIASDVFIATDVSDWRADAIKLHRLDGLHFAVTSRLPSGTIIHYRYTRGSWQTGERNKAGQEGRVRQYIVPEADTAQRDDTVPNWADLLPGGAVPQILGAPPTPAPVIKAP